MSVLPELWVLLGLQQQVSMGPSRIRGLRVHPNIPSGGMDQQTCTAILLQSRLAARSRFPRAPKLLDTGPFMTIKVMPGMEPTFPFTGAKAGLAKEMSRISPPMWVPTGPPAPASIWRVTCAAPVRPLLNLVLAADPCTQSLP
jgi:hypothetical protein